MGKGLLHQCRVTPGFECVAVADLVPEKAVACVAAMALPFRVVSTAGEMIDSIRRGELAVCADGALVAECPEAGVLIESSSAITEAGCYAVAALETGKHLVMMNAEADLTFGPCLMQMAHDRGLVYTSCDGDQHGVIKRLIGDVELWGFELVMAGNIKGFLDRYSNPTKIIPEADARNLDYRMATAYTDGTKLSVEMALVANALGLRTHVPGMHGPRAGHVRDVLRLFDFESLWNGRVPCVDYILGAEPAVAVPPLLELTQMRAAQEMLKAKVLLDRYAEAGLTDATTLSEAIENAAGKLQVVGAAKGVTHQAAVRGDYAVAYVMAEESAIAAHLLSPAALDEVRAAYRDAMHRQARELMQRSDWKNALLLWQHLHKRKLVSQQLYLDAARCFQQLGEEQDALRVLTEAVEAFSKASAPDFFEQAGDVAALMKSGQAQELAEKAYRMASEQLRDSVSPAPPRPENNIQP